MCERHHIILGATARWSGGIRRLKESASESRHRCCLEAARRIVIDFVAHDNNVRLQQRDRLRHARGQNSRSRPGDLHRTESEAGSGEGTEANGSRAESAHHRIRIDKVIARVISRGYDDGWPERRIGLRGDTARAPIQGPRPKEGGTMPP